jgi:hypothetical protein
MIETVEQLGPTVGVKRGCQDLGVPRSSLYRARQPQSPAKPRPKQNGPKSGRCLTVTGSRMLHPGKCTPPYWTRGLTCATGERCIEF